MGCVSGLKGSERYRPFPTCGTLGRTDFQKVLNTVGTEYVFLERWSGDNAVAVMEGSARREVW